MYKLQTTNYKLQILILVLASCSLFACSKNDSIEPIQKKLNIVTNEDPQPDYKVTDNLNTNYHLDLRHSEHHIRCKRGGRNCYQDGFIDPIHPNEPIVIKPNENEDILWVIFEYEGHYDTVVIEN